MQQPILKQIPQWLTNSNIKDGDDIYQAPTTTDKYTANAVAELYNELSIDWSTFMNGRKSLNQIYDALDNLFNASTNYYANTDSDLAMCKQAALADFHIIDNQCNLSQATQAGYLSAHQFNQAVKLRDQLNNQAYYYVDNNQDIHLVNQPQAYDLGNRYLDYLDELSDDYQVANPFIDRQ